MENPYWLAVSAPEPRYLTTIAVWSALWAALFLAVDWTVSRGGRRKTPFLEAMSSPRPGATTPAGEDGRGEERSGLTAATTVCSTVHAAGTSFAAVRTVLLLMDGDQSGLAPPLWQAALAFSQGYFVADALLYGTRRESWVLIHHTWMIIAHHPIGEPSRGCMLMGCGSCARAIWLSATGYGAEISTIFLNIRKFQHWWLQEHSTWYTVNSVLLLVTYPTSRVLAAGAIIWGSLLPHWPEYQRNNLGGLITFTVVTYCMLALMSAFYTYSLISKGLTRALFFTPVRVKEQ